MARSVWKGPFVESYVLKKAEAARESGRKDNLWLDQFGKDHLLRKA